MADVRERGSRKAGGPPPGGDEAQPAGWLDRVNAFGERHAKPIIVASTVLVIVTVLIIVDTVNKQYQIPKAERERAAATSSKDLQDLKEKYRSVPAVLPQIVLSLGNQLYKENKLEDARKEYEEFSNRWPGHWLNSVAIQAKQRVDEDLKYAETSREAALHSPDLEIHPLTATRAAERIRAIRGELKGLKDKTDAESKDRAARLADELGRLTSAPTSLEPMKEPHPALILKLKSAVVRLELFEDEAPNATAQLVDLANKKYYDGLKFKVGEDELRLIPSDKAPVAGLLPFEPTTRDGDVGSVLLVRRPDGSGNLAGEFVILLKDRPLTGETVVGMVPEGALPGLRKIAADDAIESATLDALRDHEYKPALLPEKK